MITARTPDLKPVIMQLTQNHNMISYLINAWQHAMETGATPAEQLRHLDGIDAVMTTHFRYEELKLLGVLDGLDGDGLSKNDLFGAIA